MEINVTGTVFVEVGPQTLALLTGGVKNVPVADKSVKELREDAKANLDQLKEREAEVSKKETKPATEKPKAESKPKVDAFADMDDDAKLEAIKTEVTRQTKNKKGADVKFMLAQFDAGRASELAPENYDAFYDAIVRYGKGEKVEEIFPGDEDLN